MYTCALLCLNIYKSQGLGNKLRWNKFQMISRNKGTANKRNDAPYTNLHLKINIWHFHRSYTHQNEMVPSAALFYRFQQAVLIKVPNWKSSIYAACQRRLSTHTQQLQLFRNVPQLKPACFHYRNESTLTKKSLQFENSAQRFLNNSLRWSARGTALKGCFTSHLFQL